MWNYEKLLAYPVDIPRGDAAPLVQPVKALGNVAALALAMRYQANGEAMKALLTDIGTECANNLEVLVALYHQLSGENGASVNGEFVPLYGGKQDLLHAIDALIGAYDALPLQQMPQKAKEIIAFLRMRSMVHRALYLECISA